MASRLAEILTQEYKSKGIFGGAASAIGKRTREKLDIRNSLFGGSGVGSIVGRKIFGKGYSATGRDSKISTDTNALSSGSSSALQELNMNSQISAKNSTVLPKIAFDMNIMKQNIVKLVKAQGVTPSKRADMYFQKQKERNATYKNLLGSKPSKVEKVGASEGSESIIGGIIGGIVSKLGTGLLPLIGTAVAVGVALNNLRKAFNGFLDWFAGTWIGKKLGIQPSGTNSGGGNNGAEPGSPGSDQPGQKSFMERAGDVATNSVEAFGEYKALRFGQKIGEKVPKFEMRGAGVLAEKGGGLVKASKVGGGGKLADVLEKLRSFAVKSTSKGWGPKITQKITQRLGRVIAFKCVTLFAGFAAAPFTAGISTLISIVSALLLMKDIYDIYEAIFGTNGIEKELEDEDKDTGKSTSPTMQKASTDSVPGATPTASNETGNSPSPVGSGPSNLQLPKGKSISSNEATDYLVKKGMTPEQAAGVVGNLLQESKLNSGAQNASEGAYGIAQWRGSRLTELQNFAASRGKTIDDVNTQLDFIMHELNGKEKRAGEMLFASKTAEEAAYNFGKYYERPKTVEQSRMNFASQTLAQYKPTGGGGSSNVQLAQVGDGMGSGGAEMMAASNAVNDAKNSPAKSQPVQVAQDNRQTTVNNNGGGGGGSQMTAYDQYFGKYLINRTT